MPERRWQRLQCVWGLRTWSRALGSSASRSQRELKGWQASYRKRRGRPDPGTLTADDATVALREAIAAHAEVTQRRAEVGEVPSFEDAAKGWLEARRVEGGAKRKTLDDWNSMLRDAEDAPRRRGRTPSAWLWAVPKEVAPGQWEANAEDLHVGHNLRLELTANWLRVLLTPGTCGNTLARLIANLQHRFDARTAIPVAA